MTEYTATEVRELVAELPVLKIATGAEASEVEALRDALEGADELVRELPAGERAEALVDDSLLVGRSLWVPVVQNCRLAAGLSLSAEDGLTFAVKGEGSEFVEYFSAREAMRHLISGAADIAEDDMPAPEENGKNTRRAAGPRTVSAPDASGVSCKDLLPEENEEAGPGPDTDVDRDDVAADGLDQPAGGVRYLGAFADLAEPTREEGTAEPDAHERCGVHPDWRVRLSCLLLGGSFPWSVTPDIRRAVEFLGEDATPGRFMNTLAAWRAALSAEDLVQLSRLDREGAIPASEIPTRRTSRLAEGARASLRLVGGELMLVSGDPEWPETLVADALGAARQTREFRKAGESFRLSERIRKEITSRGPRPASLEAFVHRISPICGGRGHALRELGKLIGRGILSAHWSGGRVLLCTGDASPEDLEEAAHLADDVLGRARANKKTTSSLRRAGKKGLSSRLEAAGAPEDEVCFWRAFEYKEGRPGEFRAAFPAPVVPYGGTPVDPDELPEVLALERAKASARDSGRVSARVEYAGEWGFRLYRFGRTICARTTMLSRRSKVFRSETGAAHCWPVSRTEVLHDPEGHYAAQLAEERVAFGAPRRDDARSEASFAPSGFDRHADASPGPERESGPEPEGSYSKRGRDPLSAERRGEAIIRTKTGKVLTPSLRPRQRERARKRAREIVRLRDRALGEHLAALPVAERLELYLALYGPKAILVLKERAADPTGLLLAVRQLKREGRIELEDDHVSAPALSAERTRDLNSRLATIARRLSGAA